MKNAVNDILGAFSNCCCGVATDHELQNVVKKWGKIENRILALYISLLSKLTWISENPEYFSKFQENTRRNFYIIISL